MSLDMECRVLPMKIQLDGETFNIHRGIVHTAKLECGPAGVPRDRIMRLVGTELDGRKIIAIEAFAIPRLFNGASLGVMFEDDHAS